MKQIWLAVGVSGVLLLGGLNLQALQYVDYDRVDRTLDDPSDSVTGSFNIITLDGNSALDRAGYNALAEVITSATVYISFFDANSTPNTVSISLGSILNLVDYTVPSPFVPIMFSTANGTLTGSALMQLTDLGEIDYTIEWGSGDPFTVSDLALMVETAPRSTAVPDGGTTIGLLGAALVAFGCFRRRLA